MLDESNWMYLKHFHPIEDTRVKQLFHINANTIEELTKVNFNQNHSITIKDQLNNNIWFSRLDKGLKKIKIKY